MKKSLVGLPIVLSTLWVVSFTQAQPPVTSPLTNTTVRQYPSLDRPTLSPYLELFREQQGVLPNYHQFVRPRLQLRGALIDQNRTLRTQQQQLRRLDTRVAQPQRPTTSSPTGIGGTFGNTLHFFGGGQ